MLHGSAAYDSLGKQSRKRLSALRKTGRAALKEPTMAMACYAASPSIGENTHRKVFFRETYQNNQNQIGVFHFACRRQSLSFCVSGAKSFFVLLFSLRPLSSKPRPAKHSSRGARHFLLFSAHRARPTACSLLYCTFFYIILFLAQLWILFPNLRYDSFLCLARQTPKTYWLLVY